MEINTFKLSLLGGASPYESYKFKSSIGHVGNLGVKSPCVYCLGYVGKYWSQISLCDNWQTNVVKLTLLGGASPTVDLVLIKLAATSTIA